MPWPNCDVCQTGEAISVNCSATGPMSFAFCAECHGRLAEPEWTFVYLWDGVADGDPERLASFVNQLSTFKDGRYWTWKEWAEWKRWEWFDPDPMFHPFAFKPHGPLDVPPEFTAMMEGTNEYRAEGDGADPLPDWAV